MNTEYKCVTTVDGIHDYIGGSRIVAFDFETAPDDPYREEDKAALDPARAHIVGCSFSVKEGTGIYVPVAHRIGTNIDRDAFFAFLTAFLMDKTTIKIAHNIAFESSMAYARGIVIQAPVYDTICASQMSLKSIYEFRKLNESGLKRLAEELFGEPLPSFSSVTDGKHFDELDAQDEETVRYGSADSDFALRLYHKFNDWFDRYLPKHRYIVEEIESPTAVYLGIMKTNGIPVNLPLMQERKAEAENEMERIRKEIEFIIGDVNIGANCSTQAFKNYLYKDLGLPILKTTETNREAADDMTMTLLKEWCDENRPGTVGAFHAGAGVPQVGQDQVHIYRRVFEISQSRDGLHPSRTVCSVHGYGQDELPQSERAEYAQENQRSHRRPKLHQSAGGLPYPVARFLTDRTARGRVLLPR
jgi:DNA polymerase-1